MGDWGGTLHQDRALQSVGVKLKLYEYQEGSHSPMLTLTIQLEDGQCDNMGDTLSISQLDKQTGVINVVIVTRKDIHRIQTMMVLGGTMASDPLGGTVQSTQTLPATKGPSK